MNDDGPATAPPIETDDGAHARDRLGVGLVLIAIAVLFGLAQSLRIDWLAQASVFLLGVLLYVSGIVRRNAGALIPGGILIGVGGGILLTSRVFTGEASGAAFLLAFAAGWVLITIGTALFTERTMWWPLIPATIMSLVGLAAAGMTQGQWLLRSLGDLWWIALLVAGLYLVVTRDRPSRRRYRRIDSDSTNP
jgi:hypothetical protein